MRYRDSKGRFMPRPFDPTLKWEVIRSVPIGNRGFILYTAIIVGLAFVAGFLTAGL